MDAQNAAFPGARDVGGAQIQEIQAVQYPFFVDVRPDAMDKDNMIVANLPTVSMNWSSPIAILMRRKTAVGKRAYLNSSRMPG